MYVLRLWAHCQSRMQDRFELSSLGLKAICRFAGSAEQLEAAMTTAGFVCREGGCLVAAKWREYNARLFANQENGKKGGRPKKPKVNPRVSSGLGKNNPTKREQSRAERSGVDKSSAATALPSSFDWDEALPGIAFLLGKLGLEKKSDWAWMTKAYAAAMTRCGREWLVDAIEEACRDDVANKGGYVRKVLGRKATDDGFSFDDEVKKFRVPDGILSSLQRKEGCDVPKFTPKRA